MMQMSNDKTDLSLKPEKACEDDNVEDIAVPTFSKQAGKNVT